MKEQDLLNLGFQRFEQDDEDDKFYYYSYDLKGESGGGSLLTQGDDEVVDGEWYVYAWDINENLRFQDAKDVETYIRVIEKNILTE